MNQGIVVKLSPEGPRLPCSWVIYSWKIFLLMNFISIKGEISKNSDNVRISLEFFFFQIVPLWILSTHIVNACVAKNDTSHPKVVINFLFMISISSRMNTTFTINKTIKWEKYLTLRSGIKYPKFTFNLSFRNTECVKIMSAIIEVCSYLFNQRQQKRQLFMMIS